MIAVSFAVPTKLLAALKPAAGGKFALTLDSHKFTVHMSQIPGRQTKFHAVSGWLEARELPAVESTLINREITFYTQSEG